jgi:hypothetical protein
VPVIHPTGGSTCFSFDPFQYREALVNEEHPMTTPQRAEPPAWITWPIRAVALIVVFPFRLLWELAVLIYRFVCVPIGRALGWLLRTFLLAPLLWLLRQLLQWVLLPIWHALRWVGAALVTGVAWVLRMLLRYVLTPIALAIVWVLTPVVRALYNWVLAPLGHAVAWLLVGAYRWVLTPVGHAIVWAFHAAYRWILRPIGSAIGWTARAAYRWILVPIAMAISWSCRVIYRYVLRPVGLAIAFGWRYTFGAAFRGIAATSRWLNTEIFRPVGHALGLRR